MTPKEQYEARKALRRADEEKRRHPQQGYPERPRNDDELSLLLLERFVAAVEQIAARLPPPPEGEA